MDKKGPSYIAPDGALPIPKAVWERLEMRALERTIEVVKPLGETQDEIYTLPADERAVLSEVGGVVLADSIETFLESVKPSDQEI